MARNTTATTALALISFSAARSTFSPVVGLVLLQFQDRPPLPEPRYQVDIAAGRGVYDREVVLLAYRVLVDHRLRFSGEFVGLYLVGFIRQVLFAGTVPVDHHEEHDEPPGEGDDDPGKFDFRDRFFPPDALRWWCYCH
jgi:hypothetical protein